MIFSLQEILHILIMTLATGYIFMDAFRARTASKQQTQEPTIEELTKQSRFDWDALWFSCLVTAPALILHELGHKFIAMGFGLEATFHAAFSFLGLGLVLKFIGSPFIFLVPAYVSIVGQVMPSQAVLIAFAGPGINGILAGISWFITKKLKSKEKQQLSQRTSLKNSTKSNALRKKALFWHVTLRINLLLFGFNMLPIPGFDGLKVYINLYQLIFG